MVCFPPSKINLGLRVMRKRDDGYHDIETCFYPLPWNDILEIIPSKTMSFTNTGIKVPGRYDDNLCLKAYYLLQEEFDLPSVDIHLHKIVPMGAGLGGGSSDAANTLLLLNDLFSLNLSNSQLEKFASKLGSDCAFFIQPSPMIGRGRGEILSTIDVSLKGKYTVVIKPNVHVSTRDAYNGVKPNATNTSIDEILKQHSIQAWRELLVNDFEPSVFKQFPIIQQVKKELYNQGAVYASMSGSGSAVYGIFNAKVDLSQYAKEMDYWSGTL